MGKKCSQGIMLKEIIPQDIKGRMGLYIFLSSFPLLQPIAAFISAETTLGKPRASYPVVPRVTGLNSDGAGREYESSHSTVEAGQSASCPGSEMSALGHPTRSALSTLLALLGLRGRAAQVSEEAILQSWGEVE